MEFVKKQVATLISSALASAYGDVAPDADTVSSALEYPPSPENGDLAFPCFRLSKVLRKAPPVIAQTICDNIAASGMIKEIKVVSGYLNFYLDRSVFASALISEVLGKGENYGKSDEGKGKVCVLDYSSPNVAKPFHIGHLGTTVIGHSIKKIHEFCGYSCVGINYLGDWGTQFGKLILAYKKWGSKEEVEKGGVDALVALYVRINNEISAEEAENAQENTDDAPGTEEGSKRKRSPLGDEARAEFAKLEHGDEENLALWKWFVSVSLREYEKTYELLGITFDSYKGESFYTDKMPAQVQKLRDMGLLKIDDGASIVDLSEWNMPACLILKSDGTTLYPTRDIAAAVYRHETYNFDKAIYVTSSAQSLHFAQWFKVVELMGYDWYGKLHHVPYGTVSIGGKKLATRTGNVILLKDLFRAAIEKALAITEEKNPGLENKQEAAEAVGVGAILYHYLSGSRIKDIDFTIEDALSFEGNTGPYVQYTYARTCSILAKAAEAGKYPGSPEGAEVTADEEFELCKVLALFPEKVKAALDAYEPSVITRYIFEVATVFNRFYHNCQVIGDDERVTSTRLMLTKAAGTVLKSAFGLICMKAPEKI